MDILLFIDVVTSLVGKVDKVLSLAGPEMFFQYDGREPNERSCVALSVKTRTQHANLADLLRENNIEFKSDSSGNGVTVYFPKMIWNSDTEKVCGSFSKGA